MISEEVVTSKDKLFRLQVIARFALRVVRHTQPVDDAGYCHYCVAHIIQVGAGEQEDGKHAEHCMWEIMRLEAEEYHHKYGKLTSKRKDKS